MPFFPHLAVNPLLADNIRRLPIMVTAQQLEVPMAKSNAPASSSKANGKSNGAAKSAKTAAKGKPVESLLESNVHLQATLQQIEKQFGEGAIMPLGSRPSMQIEGISTGSLSLDIALGGLGIPRGRIVEVYRSGIERQDDTGTAHGGRGTEIGWHCGLYRCRACPRSSLGQETGRPTRNAARQSARQWRGGHAHRRNADQAAMRST